MFRGFFDFLAKMGLSVRDDPPKILDLTIRSWGEPVDGLVLSVSEIPREDPAALPRVSVVIRNVGNERKSLTVPGWLFFYHVEVRLPDDSPAALSPFGRQLLRPERRTGELVISLGPGDFQETEIPVGSLFTLRSRVRYPLSVWCIPDLAKEEVTLRSNRITIG